MILRFAPSPTGLIHIGNLRTAIFNWIYARKHKAQFHLRIEDTDLERNRQEAIDLILHSLEWLKIDYDSLVIQSQNIERHKTIIQHLLNSGKAYKCYCSKERIDTLREHARLNQLPRTYDGHCRLLMNNTSNIHDSSEYVVRLLVNRPEDIIFHDHVFGTLTKNTQDIDDFIIQRTNGMPVYLLSVVVDDHDMNITHVMRGADHIPNTFPQILLYKALEWKVPEFIHIPLIHGEDGAKLSKRHGAVSLTEYQESGIIREALLNGLLRLGWAHNDEEIISTERAFEIFDIDGMRKSAARFDYNKILSLNAYYINHMDDNELFDRLYEYSKYNENIMHAKSRIICGMKGIKSRCKTLKQMLDMAKIYFLNFSIEGNIHLSLEDKKLLSDFSNYIKNYDNIESDMRSFCKNNNIKLSSLAQMLRLVLTGLSVSPSMFEVIEVLQEETINRINKVLSI